MKRCIAILLAGLALAATAAMASGRTPATTAPGPGYFDNSGRDDVLAGGVKMIPITTPRGTFHVWTRRVGNNPKLKVLLLHGGPGATHERRVSVMTRACGSPKTPLISSSGRKPANRYWFIRANSLEEAARIAAENPCLAYGLVCEVRPLDLTRASAYVLTNETPT